MVIQKYLLKWLLTPINSIMQKTPSRLRDILFIVGGLGLTLHCMLKGAGLTPYRFLFFFPISCIFMGLVILGSMGSGLTPVKFRLTLFIPWICCGAIMLISGIINNVDYIPDAILILVAFPILYICWGNCERNKLFTKLILINKLTLLIFILLSFLFIQITTKKYYAFAINPNTTSTLLSVSSAFLLIEIISEKKFSKKLVCDVMLFGAAAAINYYTNSRTGPLALICSALIVLILYSITNPVRQTFITLAKLALTILISAVLSASLLYVFQLRQWLPIPYVNLKDQTVYTDDRWKDIFSPPADEPAPTDSPVNQAPTQPNKEPDKPFFDDGGFKDVNKDKLNTDKTLDKFSTGRISVWKAYAKDLNLTGHSTTPTVYIDFLFYKNISSTHMTILQVAYESGVVAGILYFIFNITSGILAIVYSVRHKKEKFALLPLAIIVVFGCISLLESNRVAFTNYNTLMYYLMLFPVMTKIPSHS